jgi:hypothetical protein
MRSRERGVGLLIPVLLVVTVAAFAVIVAASQSGGDIRDTDANADSIQALYLAETGIERALKRYATGTACGAALAQTINDLGTIGLGATAYRIEIFAGLTTDFSSVPLVSSQTQCRVRVTGTVLASNVSRTIHAIVDKNLLMGVNNHNFNNPTSAGAPSGWTLNPAGAVAAAGGPDGAPCTRSAWLLKSGGGARNALGQLAIPTAPVGITVAAGTTTTVHFHSRVLDRASVAGCPAVAAGPGFFCGGGPATETSICFFLTSTAGGPWPSGRRDKNATAAGVAACPSTFAPCSTNYGIPAPPGAYPVKDALTIPHGAAVTLNGFAYNMLLQNAGFREFFLDNIELVNPTALNAARVQVWRDCSTAPCP